jgi:broad specificity phosphatase PhoE
MPEFEPEHSAADRREGEKPSIRIIFRRHDQKMVESTSGPRLNDATVGLTPEGRANAARKGKELGINPAMAVLGGSGRNRSTETVRLMAQANEPGIDDIVGQPGSEIEQEEAHGKQH